MELSKGMPQGINSLRAFIPAKNYHESRRFYRKLGFTESWYSDALALFWAGDQDFYLQNFYSQEYADNFMMFLVVEDVDQWWMYLSDLNLSDEFHGTKLIPPRDEDWGRECLLMDPSGVLWHFGNFKENI